MKKTIAKSKSKIKTKSKPKARIKTKTKIKAKSKTCLKQEMSDVSLGYLIAGIFEAVMAIPFMGWLMGVGSSGFFWIAGLVINIVVLVVIVKSKKSISGNVVGIIANIIGWVPILGWFFHLVATILLFVLFFKEERK